jgi:hypothetical protein
MPCLRRPRRLQFVVVAGTTLTSLAGCALGVSTEGGSLAGACQLRTCECAKPRGPLGTFADIQPVQWRDNGDAVCPDGYQLRLVSR